MEKKAIAIDEDGKFLVLTGTVMSSGSQRSNYSSTREAKQTSAEGIEALESAEEPIAPAQDAKQLAVVEFGTALRINPNHADAWAIGAWSRV